MGLLHKAKKTFLMTVFLVQAATGLSNIHAQHIDKKLASEYVEAVRSYVRTNPDADILEDSTIINQSLKLQEQVRQAAADSLREENLTDFKLNLSILHAFANAARDTALANQIYTIKEQLQDEHWKQRVLQAERFVKHVIGLSDKEFEAMKQRVQRTPVSISIDYNGTTVSYAYDGENRPLTITREQNARKVLPYDAIVDAVIAQTPDATLEYRDIIINEILDYLEKNEYVIEK